MSCNFDNSNWKCFLEEEKGSHHCYWHQKIDGKGPSNKMLDNLKTKEIRYIYLKNARLEVANLKGAFLEEANLQGADLTGADLQGANLMEANLEGANLMGANLEGSDLRGTNLQNAELQQSFFDAKSQFNSWTVLTGSNLHMSLIDQAISFRYAKFFKRNKYDEKEINEITADNCNQFIGCFSYKGDIILDLQKLKKKIVISDDLLVKLKDLNVIYEWNWNDGSTCSVFSYKSFLEHCNKNVFSFNETKILNNILFSPAGLPKRIVVCKDKDCLLKIDRSKYYEAAFEVYNNLYNFYSQQADMFRTKHVHYRRAEVNRKLLLHRNKLNTINGLSDRIRSYFFDWMILKNLTEYGESILRPISIAFFGIIGFGLLYRLLNGIEVANRTPKLLDYIYLSSSTFSGLGIVGVQPNFTLPLMQPLIILESAFGIGMISIIIFVITYQIAR